MKKILLICISVFWFSIVQATCELSGLVGWTIIEVKTIKGYKDDGEEEQSNWKGCKFGRRVLFSDRTTVKCASYNYQYAYYPEAVILGTKMKSGGVLLQMCVEGELIDIMN